MNKLRIIAKNELYRYFVSPLAYVYLLAFLVLNASFALYFGDFFNRGQADLWSMFAFQPWLYLLFIPGISMRLWAEEFRSKTVVQLVTMPVDIRTLVMGKFVASWLFCGLALVLTFPFWITVNVLGNPDNQVIALSYVASFVLAGCMLAISQTMSAITKNQVIALVLAVIANLMFFWSGIEYILSVFRLFLPDTIIDVIASFSFISHFDTLSRGLVELRDVIFFASIIIFFNFTTILIVNFKTAGTSGWLKSTSKTYYISAWTMLLVAFFGVNILANNLMRNVQYDATEEKIFTLTDNTKNILQNLPEPVLAKLYFSPILEERNPALRSAFDNVRLLLKKYRDVSDGNFDFKIYHPEFLSQQEDIALAIGIQPVPLIDLNQNALFGMSIEDTLQNKSVIPFFTAERQGELEQELTTKIHQLHKKKKALGVLTPLSIFGADNSEGAYLGQQWQIVDVWNQNYELINIVSIDDFEHIDVLILFHPHIFAEEFNEAIKNFSRKGGKILLFLDPANEASRLYSGENFKLIGSDLGDLADFWHIRFYKDYVVADLQNSITVDATADYKKNPTFVQDVVQFRLKKDDMNPKHPVTANLNEILLASASVVMPEPEAYKNKKVEFYPLLKASQISQIMPASVVVDGLNPKQILHYFSPDNNQKILAGEFISLDKDNPFDIIAVADTDFLYDTFWSSQRSYMGTNYVVNNFDNANFVLNAIDYLAGNKELIGLRGKQMKNRSFAEIEKMRKLNSLRYSQQENEIYEKIDTAKKAMSEVWNKKDFEERENFTADELASISGVRKELEKLIGQLSDIRLNAFNEIKQIDNLISLINLALIPAIIVLILLGIKLLKWIKVKNKVPAVCCCFDAKLAKLAGGCVLIFAIAMLSVYLVNRSSVDAFENKKAFPNIEKRLNDINSIVLQSHNNKLTFVKENGEWVIEEQRKLPVYQERIRHLMATLAEARLFERKTNKAENLAMFDLLPIDDEASKAVQIEIFNDNELIQRFYLGDYNVDLGRGSKAAYIKYDNQFQVWKIKADFVDMNLDYHVWTYGNLWDLRYGRLYSPLNDEKEQNNLMELMKYMLNTQITPVETELKTLPIARKKLYVEGVNEVVLQFYRENDKAYVKYEFGKHNDNIHLLRSAKLLDGKIVEISNDQMEKILDNIKL